MEKGFARRVLFSSEVLGMNGNPFNGISGFMGKLLRILQIYGYTFENHTN